MKILLVLGKYLPEKNGGIENYSHWLATVLLQNGYQVDAAILNCAEMETYTYEDVQVVPLKNGFQSFKSLLQERRYDICHFQEYSAFGGIELFWFKEAKQYCKKVFFTFHLPYFTCFKSDFRYMGVEDCNNFSSLKRCARCIVATKLSYKKSRHFNLYNYGIHLITPLLQKTSKIARLKAGIQSRKAILNELINTCDNLFIYANWFKEILNKNGYQSTSIKKIPYITKTELKRNELNVPGTKNKILFVGRIEHQKGLHLLCKAMNLITTSGVQLDVLGNIVDNEYFNNCKKDYAFNFKETVPLPELLKMLRDYDFLILPSVFTEMYSMIVKNAFYENLPVIASAAKGNIDAIEEGKNGFIFNYDNQKDLARVIDHAYTLKSHGWKPVFEKATSQQESVTEILSYYSL